MKKAARLDADNRVVSSDSVSPSNSETSTKGSKMAAAQGSPTKQRMPRKRTKSLGNLRIRSQTDKDLVPPRPPNAWILYRSTKFKEFKAKQDSLPSSLGVTPPLSNSSPSSTGSHQPHPGLQGEVSRIISDMWKTERQDVKMKFVKLAEEKKNQHMEMFPDYKYRPKRQQSSASAVAALKDKKEDKAAPSSATKKNKSKAKAKTGSIHVDVPLLMEKIDVDSGTPLDSPILLDYPATGSLFGIVATPMQEDTDRLQETQDLLVEEMQRNNLLRIIANSGEQEMDTAASPSTAFSFDYFPQDGLYSTPPSWEPRFAPHDEMGSTPIAPLSIIPHQRWNTPLSSSTSWHSTANNEPWNGTEMIETLDGEDSASNYCPPLSSTPDYLASSSPLHPYSGAISTSGTMSSSSLYLGIPITQSEDPLQPSYNFDATPSDIADDAIIRASSLNPHVTSYPESYFPRYQETVPLYYESTHASVDLHTHSPIDNGNGNRLIWSAPLMEKPLPPLPFQQQQHHLHHIDGLGIVSPALKSNDWQTHPLRTPIHLHHFEEGSTDISLHFDRSSRAKYSPDHHHHHKNQQQVSLPPQYNPRSVVPWQEDYHAHQELISQLHRLAREDVSSTAITTTSTIAALRP